jgi:hypothetical protein
MDTKPQYSPSHPWRLVLSLSCHRTVKKPGSSHEQIHNRCILIYFNLASWAASETTAKFLLHREELVFPVGNFMACERGEAAYTLR